jgi:hypothetical protein
LIASVRRECPDYVIVLSAAGLRQIQKLHAGDYETSRAHLSPEKDAPDHDV